MTTNETDAQMLARIEAAMREDLSNNIPLDWVDLETGFDSSGRACGDVIMLLYNNATRLIALARDGLDADRVLRENASMLVEALEGETYGTEDQAAKILALLEPKPPELLEKEARWAANRQWRIEHGGGDQRGAKEEHGQTR